MAKDLQKELRALGQIVLVLQGGGALGAYQIGVYQALHEAGIEPDWVIGTSIGAINAALIAGNPPEQRMEALLEFWGRVEQPERFGMLPPALSGMFRTANAMFGGIANFFEPRALAFTSPHLIFAPERASYYSTDALRDTLSGLVDFDRINSGATRMTVGAVNVGSGEMRYFDTSDTALSLDHVMASGALPPAFPAVRIDGELYWDGGIVSNTPVEAVFDDEPRRNSVVFAVHLWNPHGPEPESIWQVTNRQKDIQYASRANSHIKRQRQLHRLRHIVQQLAAKIPADSPFADEVKELRAYGCSTRIHVLRMLAPQLEHEDHTKDVDFSTRGIRERREAGYEQTKATLALGQWREVVSPLEGFVLHEAMGGRPAHTEAAKD